jgi:hypothetical protein
MSNQLVTIATWADLGYRRVGPRDANDIARSSSILTASRHLGWGEIKDDSSGKWIRRKERTKAFIYKPYTTKKAILDESNFKTKVPDIIDQYLSSKYAQYRGEASIESVRESLYKDKGNKSILQVCKSISEATMFCPLEMFKILLIEDILPIFFELDNKGKVFVFLDNYEYMKMTSFLRAYYTNDIYPISSFPPKWGGGFPTLRKWQDIDPSGFFNRILSFLNLITYPFILGFDAGKYGLRFLFLFSREVKQDYPIYPIDWMHWVQSDASFGGENREIDEILKDATGIVHGRYQWNWRPSIDEIQGLVNWLWEKSSRIFFELSDPCNFITSGNIDGVWAYENLLTIDRLLRQTIRALSTCDVGNRKSFVFEIADLWGTIAKSYGKVGSDVEFFKILFNPDSSKNLLFPIIRSLPFPFNEKIKEVVESIYSELTKNIMESVWAPGKKTSNDILVRDRNLTTERNEDINSFTANVMRALRNAHHGYLTKQDPGFRPSRYLFLVTGDVPDSLSYLPILWWLCFLASPKDMVNFNCLPIQYYESV